MNISEFDYYIPKNQIAQYPLPERGSSKLFVLHRKVNKFEHRVFRDIVEYLHAGDVLVINDTRVIPARLNGVKPSGGKAEILLLEEIATNTWKALVKGIKQGTVILNHGITADVSRYNGAAEVTFNKNSPTPHPKAEGARGRGSNLIGDDIRKSLNKIGEMPLPPYIKRKVEGSDVEHYQTVYAKKEGAIASPTAGLHFTDELLNLIKKKGVEIKTLTLHVGYGTFKPVLTGNIKKHRMDEEFYEIPEATADAVNCARAEGKKVVAVGTTVTRALEASAADGSTNRVKAGAGKASILICPGYRFKIIDALITNLHQPKSTPMMLTSAFSGLSRLKRAYSETQRAGYRFFSYGDAMMII